MVWLLAFLVAHAAEIGAIGATLYVVNQVEQVAVTTTHLIKDAKEDK